MVNSPRLTSHIWSHGEITPPGAVGVVPGRLTILMTITTGDTLNNVFDQLGSSTANKLGKE